MAKIQQFVKYEGNNEELFVKVSADALNYDAKLIVPETHNAILLKDGVMMDTLNSGSYDIFDSKHKKKTESITVDVIYMSKTAKLKVNWGTKTQFNFRDTETDVPIKVGAHGEFEVQICNPRKAYLELIGADKTYSVEKLKERLAMRMMSEVEPDCACAVAQWTQTPIAPGGKGTVSVTFDAEALGHFYKSVAVITNAEPHVVYLSLSGEVVQEIKDFSRTHPYLIGDIRLDQETLDFPDAHRGEHPVLQLGVANLSALPYEPVLMHLPPYLSAEAQPGVLQPGEKGTITLTLDTERLTDLGLTQTSVYLSRFSARWAKTTSCPSRPSSCPTSPA